MADLDEVLDNWFGQVESLVMLPPNEVAKITGAGAKVFREDLEKETNEKHRSSHDDKVYGHAADHVTMQRSNVDGKRTGASTVGWDNHYHAMNMQRLNDGTKKYQADHFVDNLRNSNDEIEKVLLAEAAEYQRKVKRAEANVSASDQ